MVLSECWLEVMENLSTKVSFSDLLFWTYWLNGTNRLKDIIFPYYAPPPGRGLTISSIPYQNPDT